MRVDVRIATESPRAVSTLHRERLVLVMPHIKVESFWQGESELPAPPSREAVTSVPRPIAKDQICLVVPSVFAVMSLAKACDGIRHCIQPVLTSVDAVCPQSARAAFSLFVAGGQHGLYSTERNEKAANLVCGEVRRETRKRAPSSAVGPR